MTHPALAPPPSLGAATEARILAAFADRCLITARAAAALLGLDEKTLRTLTDGAAIRAVRRGKLRSYTEADVRLFLTEGPDAPCRSTNRPKAASDPRNRVIPFTARRPNRDKPTRGRETP